MNPFLIAFCLATPAFSYASTNTTVDNSRAASDGVVEISISGGKGSQAQKLYNSLTGVSEQPDNAMGGHYGTAKQAKAIDCSVENDSHVKNAYQCTIKVSPSGDSIEPWK